MTLRESFAAVWRLAYPTLAIVWVVVLFGGFFIWGRVTGDKPTWWWVFVVALAPIGFFFWRRESR